MNKATIRIQYLKTPLGELIIGAWNHQICLCDWRYRRIRSVVDKRIKTSLNADYTEEQDSITHLAIQQIKAYLNQEIKEFELPFFTIGTTFQKSVWEQLLLIKYGQTDTYFSLAKKMDGEKAIRAVASANGANALALLIPCHRVIGSSGKLVGYAGGLSTKKKLLELEGAIHNQQEVLF